MSNAPNTRDLAKLTAVNIQSAAGDVESTEKAITRAMSAAASAARAQAQSHTLTDGAVNALVSVGGAAGVREIQNVSGTFFGSRGRAIATRFLGLVGALGVLATRRGTHAHAVSDKALTAAVFDITDGVHNGLVTALIGGESAAAPKVETRTVN